MSWIDNYAKICRVGHKLSDLNRKAEEYKPGIFASHVSHEHFMELINLTTEVYSIIKSDKAKEMKAQEEQEKRQQELYDKYLNDKEHNPERAQKIKLVRGAIEDLAQLNFVHGKKTALRSVSYYQYEYADLMTSKDEAADLRNKIDELIKSL